MATAFKDVDVDCPVIVPEMQMRMLVRWTVLAVVMLSTVVAAQAPNLAGQWQGTINAGKELRLVFVLSPNAAGGGLTAAMYSIDQSPAAIGATIVVQGGNVRLAIAPAGITFDGKLSADANSIVGTFVQGGGSLPLTLVRTTKETAWALPAPPKTMAADAPTVFELATIKPSEPGAQGRGITMRGPREVLTINTPLGYLIEFAYNVNSRQVIGGPPWMASDRYNVVGRPLAEGVPNERQLRAMIRTLLEDRFKLVIHRDKRELPAYALVVGSGPKLAKNDANPNGLPGLGFRAPGVLGVVNATMADFVSVMQSNVLDRPVVDRTGLQGRFDFTLNWTPDESQFRGMGLQVPPPSPDAKFPGLFTAIQEQLGLKLDSVNAPVEVIVIDGVEKPSDN
jgi:uncharacterized protein (TIGR03435 family)